VNLQSPIRMIASYHFWCNSV